MGLYLGGLIIGRIFASEIWGAYFHEGLLFFFWGGGWWGAHYCNFMVFSKFKKVINLLEPVPHSRIYTLVVMIDENR